MSHAKGAKDWHSSKHLRKRSRYLLEHPDEQIPSDVTFLVGDGISEPQKLFRSHKFILAMVSSMFQAMFYGTFPQTTELINVPDVSPTAFQYMLRYAYGENIEFDDESLENMLDLLYCAKRYLIIKLARACRDVIQLDIAALERDPCAVFQRAPQMDEEDLATVAGAGIALSIPSLVKRDSFLRLSFDCLKRIVDDPHLNVKEAKIYEGVRRWVEHNVGAVTGSALRDAFASLLHSIRFPLFSAVELADGPVKDGILTDTEVSSIFQFLFAQLKPTLPFLTVPRTTVATPFVCYFNLVTVPSPTQFRGFVSSRLTLYARPDLAPECCAFLRQLVNDQLHIRIASLSNEHSGKTVPLPEALVEERNVLSHSLQGACWFEWDTQPDTGMAYNVRIGIARKPYRYHSAVFGFVAGMDTDKLEWVPSDLWDDERVQGVANFRFD